MSNLHELARGMKEAAQDLVNPSWAKEKQTIIEQCTPQMNDVLQGLSEAAIHFPKELHLTEQSTQLLAKCYTILSLGDSEKTGNPYDMQKATYQFLSSLDLSVVKKRKITKDILSRYTDEQTKRAFMARMERDGMVDLIEVRFRFNLEPVELTLGSVVGEVCGTTRQVSFLLLPDCPSDKKALQQALFDARIPADPNIPRCVNGGKQFSLVLAGTEYHYHLAGTIDIAGNSRCLFLTEKMFFSTPKKSSDTEEQTEYIPARIACYGTDLDTF
jgi:hypothetical protein